MMSSRWSLNAKFVHVCCPPNHSILWLLNHLPPIWASPCNTWDWICFPLGVNITSYVWITGVVTRSTPFYNLSHLRPLHPFYLPGLISSAGLLPSAVTAARNSVVPFRPFALLMASFTNYRPLITRRATALPRQALSLSKLFYASATSRVLTPTRCFMSGTMYPGQMALALPNFSLAAPSAWLSLYADRFSRGSSFQG